MPNFSYTLVMIIIFNNNDISLQMRSMSSPFFYCVQSYIIVEFGTKAVSSCRWIPCLNTSRMLSYILIYCFIALISLPFMFECLVIYLYIASLH